MVYEGTVTELGSSSKETYTGVTAKPFMNTKRMKTVRNREQRQPLAPIYMGSQGQKCGVGSKLETEVQRP